MKLRTIKFAGKEYPVTFKQTPNVSNTDMKKRGLVWHMTTSMSYSEGLSWLTNPKSKVSALFIVGTNPGEITQMGYSTQKFWHAGRIYEPHDRFTAIAKKNTSGSYVNPNLYLDGVEFVGGVDKDKSKKVEPNEIELTEWQYVAAEQIAQWHAKTCGYELSEETQVIHQDIASYKPDMTNVLEEIKYRLFHKKEESNPTDTSECAVLQRRISEQKSLIETLINIIHKLLGYK